MVVVITATAVTAGNPFEYISGLLRSALKDPNVLSISYYFSTQIQSKRKS